MFLFYTSWIHLSDVFRGVKWEHWEKMGWVKQLEMFLVTIFYKFTFYCFIMFLNLFSGTTSACNYLSFKNSVAIVWFYTNAYTYHIALQLSLMICRSITFSVWCKVSYWSRFRIKYFYFWHLPKKHPGVV